MSKDKTMVPENQPVEVAEATLEPGAGIAEGGGTTPEAMPETEAVDASPVRTSPEVEELRQALDAKEQDLRRMKGTFQSQLSAKEKETQRRLDEFDQKYTELQMAQMDEETRKQFETQLQSKKFRELQTENEQLRRESQEASDINRYFQFFTTQGIRPEELIIDQGASVLAESGWTAMTREMNRLREQVAKAGQPPQQETSPNTSEVEPLQAPQVVTQTRTVPSGANWAELREKYGTDEKIYNLIDQGVLPASILPGMGNE